MYRKVAAVFLAMLIAAATMTGCAKKENKESSSETVTEAESKEETSGTEQESDTAAADVWELTAADYSYGLDENGYIKDVHTLDYVTLPDFASIVFKEADLTATDEVIEREISGMMENFQPQVKDRAVEDGDFVNIDYAGYMGEEQFENGTATGQDVTAGSQEFIDDFLTQIIGHMPGETMDVNVTFPDPYPNNPDFSGKDAKFVVTINYIHGESPELTDEWIAQEENGTMMSAYLGVSDLKTVDDVKAYITDSYYEYMLNEKISNYLTNDVVVSEVPEKVYDYMRYSTNVQLYAYYGMKMEDLVKSGYYTDENVESMLEADAKTSMFYQALAEQEGWKVAEEDLKEVTGTDDNAEYIEKFGKGYIAQMVLRSRTIEYFKEHVTIEK